MITLIVTVISKPDTFCSVLRYEIENWANITVIFSSCSFQALEQGLVYILIRLRSKFTTALGRDCYFLI